MKTTSASVMKINSTTIDNTTPRAPDSKKTVAELENLTISEADELSLEDRKFLSDQTRRKEDPTFEELMEYSSLEVILEEE